MHLNVSLDLFVRRARVISIGTDVKSAISTIDYPREKHFKAISHQVDVILCIRFPQHEFGRGQNWTT